MRKTLYITGLLILFCLIIAPVEVCAQDTVYYRMPRLRVASLKDCDYYSVITTQSTGNDIQEIRFSPAGNKTEEEHYSVLGNEKIKSGRWQTWYVNGQLKSVINYKNNQKDGLLETYWPNGHLKRTDTFVNDSCIAGVCYNESGNKLEHFDYQTAAHFRGGAEALNRYLSKKIYFPQTAQPNLNDPKEKVVLRFLVKQSGEIDDLTIMNNPDKNMAGQVLHAFKKMPKWVPATIDGNPVGQYITFPVSFIWN